MRVCLHKLTITFENCKRGGNTNYRSYSEFLNSDMFPMLVDVPLFNKF